MFAAGHLALGYLMGVVTGKAVKRSVHLPLLLFIAVLPDFDYLLPGISHRGATHSLIVQGVLAIPFLLRYRWRALPYLTALWGHSLSDLFDVAGVLLFWPLSSSNHPLIPWPLVRQLDPYLIPTEVVLTGLALIVLFHTQGFKQLLVPRRSVLLLVGPLGALAASIIGFRLSGSLLLAQASLLLVCVLPLLRYSTRVLTASTV